MCDVLEVVILAVPEVRVSLLIGLVGILLSSSQAECPANLHERGERSVRGEAVLTSPLLVTSAC